MTPIIEVNQLSKSYLINRSKIRTTLREDMTTFLRHPIQTMQEMRNRDTFWALADLSFSINPGEMIGLLGHNGAGKSTLLKIMSRITPPTQGEILLRGRVGSLLEVGTGFSLELTGRENIYLYGAILGMKQREIKKKFDEIVDFSEVGKFLDMPLKHYSSGMYVRLAFAVASHLDSEILLVDEVLAVGDVSFQEKSVKKMGQVIESGKTIILVSHNLNLIASTTQRCILLNAGKILFDGKTDTAIERYLKLYRNRPAQSENTVELTRVVLTDKSGKAQQSISPNEEVTIKLEYETKELIERPLFWISVKDRMGSIFSASMMLDNQAPEKITGVGKVSCTFERFPLIPGMYSLEVGITDKDGHDKLFHQENALHFKIEEPRSKIDYYAPMALKWLSSENSTSFIVPHTWKF